MAALPGGLVHGAVPLLAARGIRSLLAARGAGTLIATVLLIAESMVDGQSLAEDGLVPNSRSA